MSMIIDQSLINEILLKRKKIEDNPFYYLAKDNRTKKGLVKTLKEHSWWLEHPDIRKGLILEKPTDKGLLIKRAREGIRNLGRAWKFISSRSDCFNDETLLNVGALVDPEANAEGYRTSRVTLNLAYVPLNPLKVSEKVNEAFREHLDSKDNIVERAANLHLRIAGIQPFPDGNKRIARLYQDRLFHDENLPSAVVPYGEELFI